MSVNNAINKIVIGNKIEITYHDGPIKNESFTIDINGKVFELQNYDILSEV